MSAVTLMSSTLIVRSVLILMTSAALTSTMSAVLTSTMSAVLMSMTSVSTEESVPHLQLDHSKCEKKI